MRARGGQNWAELTVKRETENYLHPDCGSTSLAFPVAFGDMDDLPEIIAQLQHSTRQWCPNPWNTLDDDKKKQKASNAKRRLNRDASPLMTWMQIQAADPNGDIVRWMEGIRDRIQ